MTALDKIGEVFDKRIFVALLITIMFLAISISFLCSCYVDVVSGSVPFHSQVNLHIFCVLNVNWDWNNWEMIAISYKTIIMNMYIK